jgi:hypothetical protein
MPTSPLAPLAPVKDDQREAPLDLPELGRGAHIAKQAEHHQGIQQEVRPAADAEEVGEVGDVFMGAGLAVDAAGFVALFSRMAAVPSTRTRLPAGHASSPIARGGSPGVAPGADASRAIANLDPSRENPSPKSHVWPLMNGVRWCVTGSIRSMSPSMPMTSWPSGRPSARLTSLVYSMNRFGTGEQE